MGCLIRLPCISNLTVPVCLWIWLAYSLELWEYC